MFNRNKISKRKKAWNNIVDSSSSLNQAVMRNDDIETLDSISDYISTKMKKALKIFIWNAGKKMDISVLFLD